MCRTMFSPSSQLSPAAMETGEGSRSGLKLSRTPTPGLTAPQTAARRPVLPRPGHLERGDSGRYPGKHGQSLEAQPGWHGTHWFQQSPADTMPRASTAGEPRPRRHSQSHWPSCHAGAMCRQPAGSAPLHCGDERLRGRAEDNGTPSFLERMKDNFSLSFQRY